MTDPFAHIPSASKGLCPALKAIIDQSSLLQVAETAQRARRRPSDPLEGLNSHLARKRGKRGKQEALRGHSTTRNRVLTSLAQANGGQLTFGHELAYGQG